MRALSGLPNPRYVLRPFVPARVASRTPDIHKVCAARVAGLRKTGHIDEKSAPRNMRVGQNVRLGNFLTLTGVASSFLAAKLLMCLGKVG